MEIKYLPENTNPQNSDWLLTENDTAAQKLSVENLLALAGTPTDLQVSDINGLQTVLDDKANKSSVTALSTIVTTKANQSAVDALSTIVATKASQNAVDAKMDKSLTEINNPSANDFLILEKASDTSNRKIKLSAISSSLSGIITSSTVPSSPTTGLIWNEIDTNNRLVEAWIYLNNSWVSDKKTFASGVTSVVTGGQNAFFPIPANYNYFINSIRLGYFPNGNHTTTNYWKFILNHVKNNGTNVQAIWSYNTIGGISTLNYSTNTAINLQVTPLTDGTAQSLTLSAFKDGTGSLGVGIIYSVFVDYQLIRK